MLAAPVTVDMFWVQRMLAGVRARGEACEAVLAAAGIPAAHLERAGARVTGEQYAALFRLLMERRGDEGLGFLTRRLKPGSFALVARDAARADNLERAIHHAGQVLRLLQDDFALVPARADALAAIRLVFTDAAAGRQPFLHDLMLRVLWQFFVWLVGGRMRAVRFELAYPAPAQPDRYGYVFPAATRFGARHSAAWFDASWLAAPVRRDTAALRAYLAQAQRNIILPPRADADASTRVRDLLQPDWPDLATAATHLHVSTATLQRHLAAEHTSFRRLKDELRRDLAITALMRGKAPLDVLAQELGFADTPAFQRAFKRWTGQTPSAYRRELGAAPVAARAAGA